MDELALAGAAVTEDDWSAPRCRNKRTAYLSCVIGVIVGPLVGLLAVYLAALFATGAARYIVMGLWMAVLVAPMAIVLSFRSVKEQEKSDGVIATLAGQFEAQARGQEFESRLANALDMAEGEPEVIEVIERSFSTVLPEAPAELLLADNSHAHLHRMAPSVPTGSRRAAAWTRPTAARQRGGPRSRSSPTATTSTPAPSCATVPRAGSPPSACPCPSWAARSA